MRCRGTNVAPALPSGPLNEARHECRAAVSTSQCTPHHSLPLRRPVETRHVASASVASAFASLCGARYIATLRFTLLALLAASIGAWAQSPEAAPGGEANLVVPSLSDARITAFFGMPGANLLMVGLLVSALGMAFGLWFFTQLKNA